MGLWHLGSVTAACVASLGHRVVGFDFDEAAINGLVEGRPPLFEPGLEELVRRGLAAGNLSFSSEPVSALENAELLWVAYDTPVDDDDRADTDSVIDRVVQVLPFLPKGMTVLLSSQLPVGSTRRLEALAAAKYPDKDLGFACSPENLRLGKAIDVFMKPDRIVAGVRRKKDRDRLALLLRGITDRIEWMSIESAEMTKHAINAFLATSVVFANEIASICEVVGADAKEIERGLKSEGRIGPKAYLAPGGAFAGGTLARDIAFLNGIGQEHGLTSRLLSSVKAGNDEHKGWATRRLRGELGSLSGARIAIWGLTYKPGTDTLRRSMAVELCDLLVAEGAEVRVHDPAVKALPPSFAGSVQRFDEPMLAVEGARALVICTEWPLYRGIRGGQLAKTAPGLVVIDANRFLVELAATPGIRYLAVGTPDLEYSRATR
jgi:UDPglucose 6-dehydrogenase